MGLGALWFRWSEPAIDLVFAGFEGFDNLGLLGDGKGDNWTGGSIDSWQLMGSEQGSDCIRVEEATRWRPRGRGQSADLTRMGFNILRFEASKPDHICAAIEEKRPPAGEPVISADAKMG